MSITRLLVRGLLSGAALFSSAALVTAIALPPMNMSRFEAVSPTVQARDGALLNIFLSDDQAYRLDTTVDSVDPRYLKALLAYEDQWFWAHPGVNPIAMMRAASQWIASGRVVSGGSTITMQVARLLEPKPRTVANKWVEIVRALQLELRYSKREILNMYLTMVPMGGNLEGVRAASLRYWGKEPRNLSLSEVSLLLSVPQSPELRRPDRRASQTLSAIQWVGSRLVQAGIYPSSDLDELKQLPFESLEPMPNEAWHFSNWVVSSSLAGDRPIRTIDTSLDRRLQRTVLRKAAHFSKRLNPSENVSVMVTNGQTGEILAYVGSLGLGTDAGYMDLTRATRSPGSTLKPFIYGMAFDDGLLDSQTVLHDTPKAYGDYAPGNFDKGHRGPVRAGVALQESLNIPAVAVLSHLGVDVFQRAWEEAGLKLKMSKGADPNLGLALGAVGTRLQDLVQAYSAFANGGQVSKLTYRPVVQESKDLKSATLLTKQSASEVTQILASAQAIDGRVSRSSLRGGIQASFKTGTSYGYRDSWAIGVKGAYVIGVWVGRPDGTPVVGQTGRNAALRLANDVADSLLVAGTVKPWEAKPLSVTQVDSPPVRLIYPTDGVSVVLTDAPNTQRQLQLKLSGFNESVKVLLNDKQLAREDIAQSRLLVPADGTYELKVIGADGLSDRAAFTVISQTLY